MGDRGKFDDMKNRRTSAEALEPDPDKAALDKPETRESMATQATPQRPTARLGREVQVKIGQQLRGMYDEIVHQGVPPQFTDLVRRLTEQE
jgi:hypothetical protein